LPEGFVLDSPHKTSQQRPINNLYIEYIKIIGLTVFLLGIACTCLYIVGLNIIWIIDGFKNEVKE